MRRNPPLKISSQEKMELDLTQEPILLSQGVLDKILTLEIYRLETLAVFCLYYSTLKWKGYIPRAPETQKKLGIGRQKLLRIRQNLINLELIETIQTIRGIRTFLQIGRCWIPTHGGLPPYRGKPLNCAPTSSAVRDKSKYRLEEFEKFYTSIYPRQIGKKKAKDTWIRKIQDKVLPPLDILSTAVEKAKRTEWKNSELRYIPHPTTWLNGERWTDDYKEVPVPADLASIQDFADFLKSHHDIPAGKVTRYLNWLKANNQDMDMNKSLMPPQGKIWRKFLRESYGGK